MTMLILKAKYLSRAVWRYLLLPPAVLYLLVSLYACKKAPVEEAKKNNTKIHKLNTSYPNPLIAIHPDQRHIVYSLLTAEERSDFWLNHFQQGIIQLNASSNQKTFLESLMPQLSPAFFSLDSKIAEADLLRIAAEASMFFSDTEIRYLFVSLTDNYADFKESLQAIDAAEAIGCRCSTRNDWCSSTLACNVSDCKTSSWGCGLLAYFSCNGTCQGAALNNHFTKLKNKNIKS